MLRFYYFLMLACMLPWVAQAQAKVTFGRPYRVISSKEYLEEENKFYLKNNEEILSIKRKDEFVYIQKLDVNQLSQNKIHIYQDLPRNFQIELVTQYHGRYFFIYSSRNRNKKTIQLFSREIDFEEGIFMGKGSLLVEIPKKTAPLPTSRRFHFETSWNHAYMMIKYMLAPETDEHKGKYDVLGFAVFDSNFVKCSDVSIRMHHVQKKMENIDFSIDPQGNIFFLTKVQNEKAVGRKRRMKLEKGKYHMELSTLKFKSSQADRMPIVFEDSAGIKGWLIHKMCLFESPGDYILAAGFYNYGKEPGPANGMFLFKIGKDGKLYDIASYDIPSEITNLKKSSSPFGRGGGEEEYKAELVDLELSDLVVPEEGGFLFISEQNYKVLHPYYNRYSRQTEYYASFHYNDLLLTRIDASGRLSWMRNLPKSQSGLNGKGMMSYQYFSGDGYHYLVFMDHEENKEMKPNEVPETYRDSTTGVLTTYRVNDRDGAVKKIPLLGVENAQRIDALRIFPSRIFPISSSEFITEVSKRKNDNMLIKVEIPE